MCGLSMSQVSAIGRELGYYVDVREYFEKLKEERKRLEAELRDLGKKLKALKNERVLWKSMEDLKHVEEPLGQEIDTLLNVLNIVYFHYQYQIRRAEAEERMESLEKVIDEDVCKFLEKIEALMDHELLKDLKEFERILNHVAVAKDREYLKARFEKVEKALESLMILLGVGEVLYRLNGFSAT